MSVSENTYNRARVLEGLPGTNGKPALKPYRDIGGVWTNGYGNTRNVDPNREITEAEAERDLRQHLAEADAVVDRYVHVPLTDNQRCALLLFILNAGAGNAPNLAKGIEGKGFIGSTLLRVINDRRYTDAPAQFMRWIKFTNPKTGQREISNGLVNRRAAEVQIWSTPSPAQLTEAAALQGKPLLPQPAPNPTMVTTPAEPPQPTNVLQTSTGKATATAIGTGIAGVVANAKPIADAAAAAGGINALNLLYVLGVLFVAGCIAASVWLLWDRSRKVREEGR